MVKPVPHRAGVTAGRTRCGLRALCELLGRPRLELEPNDGLVADDPCVVTGLNDIRVARTDLLLGAVVVDNAHRARLQNADVPQLTALASHDRLD
jgi:hypothetical protein